MGGMLARHPSSAGRRRWSTWRDWLPAPPSFTGRPGNWRRSPRPAWTSPIRWRRGRLGRLGVRYWGLKVSSTCIGERCGDPGALWRRATANGSGERQRMAGQCVGPAVPEIAPASGNNAANLPITMGRSRAEARIDLEAFAHNLTVLPPLRAASRWRRGEGRCLWARSASDGQGRAGSGRRMAGGGAVQRGSGTAGGGRQRTLARVARGTEDPWGEVLEAGIDVGVSTPDHLERVAATGQRARLHLKLDTGLGRAGCPPSNCGVLRVARQGAAARGSGRDRWHLVALHRCRRPAQSTQHRADRALPRRRGAGSRSACSPSTCISPIRRPP